MAAALQLGKMASLAALPGLIAAQWVSALTAVTISVAILYALTVRIG